MDLMRDANKHAESIFTGRYKRKIPGRVNLLATDSGGHDAGSRNLGSAFFTILVYIAAHGCSTPEVAEVQT